ncbi:3788_t:CDS:2 [Acaulospora colombiana]|uniref:3788_t:CDS:1 n=2 Tax=Acaulospora colombiana TaxID=27376 RepID=A0ACA9LDM8_9GLOM|nr:3785_t:CDS:2 [Acaulospora colombiana]CAG8520838.1 3788_t:CDS:2 [Acaulospora colombiana]
MTGSKKGAICAVDFPPPAQIVGNDKQQFVIAKRETGIYIDDTPLVHNIRRNNESFERRVNSMDKLSPRHEAACKLTEGLLERGVDGVGGNVTRAAPVGRVADLERADDVEDSVGSAATQDGRVEVELVTVAIRSWSLPETGPVKVERAVAVEYCVRMCSPDETESLFTLLQLALEVVDGLLVRGDLGVELIQYRRRSHLEHGISQSRSETNKKLLKVTVTALLSAKEKSVNRRLSYPKKHTAQDVVSSSSGASTTIDTTDGSSVREVIRRGMGKTPYMLVL